MSVEFEARHCDGLSRAGKLHTDHGVVRTPAFLPVLNPNLELIAPERMRREFGVEIIITNSYIVRKGDELRQRALDEGLHATVGFDGPIMTDSGTFQSYVYGDVDVDPVEIVEFQRDIGSDIGTILDVFSTPDRTHEEAEADMLKTTERARAAPEHAGDMALALPVQGGVYEDLRERAAREASTIAHEGGVVHPIGGIVPIMERQDYAQLARIAIAAHRGVNTGRPVHFFGAGHPHMLALAVMLGADMFDSAAYAKFAKDDRLLFVDGTADLADLDELPCSCPVCHSHTVDELRGLGRSDRTLALAEHNLHTTMEELRRVRQAQHRGRLWELVIQRCHAHPALHEVLDVLLEHRDLFESVEPRSKGSAVFVTPPWHSVRPELSRAAAQTRDTFDPAGRPLVLRDATRRPYLANDPKGAVMLTRGIVPVYPSRMGPVPGPVDEAYPAAQCVDPPLGDGDVAECRLEAEELAKHWGTTIVDPPDVDQYGIEALDAGAVRLERARAVADRQFGPGAADAILGPDARVEHSPRTGRIRTVHADGDHVLSLRAEDGLYTLKLPGARRLLAATEPPSHRVVVQPETAEYNRDGRNVFAQFVLDVDDSLVPGDEAIVVTPDDELVAVGQLWMTPREIGDMERGVAVRVKDGVNKE